MKNKGVFLAVTAAVAAGAAALGFFGKQYLDERERLEQEEEAARNPQPGQRHGLFNCPKCGHDWNSYFAWVGERQLCEKCDT